MFMPSLLELALSYTIQRNSCFSAKHAFKIWLSVFSGRLWYAFFIFLNALKQLVAPSRVFLPSYRPFGRLLASQHCDVSAQCNSIIIMFELTEGWCEPIFQTHCMTVRSWKKELCYWAWAHCRKMSSLVNIYLKGVLNDTDARRLAKSAAGCQTSTVYQDGLCCQLTTQMWFVNQTRVCGLCPPPPHSCYYSVTEGASIIGVAASRVKTNRGSRAVTPCAVWSSEWPVKPRKCANIFRAC